MSKIIDILDGRIRLGRVRVPRRKTLAGCSGERNMRAAVRRLSALAGAISVAACGTTREPLAEDRAAALTGFVQAGTTTRAEVEGRLGAPGNVYEDGRVVTYAIQERDGRLTTSEGARADHTLVLEYSRDGIVARRAVVRRP